MERKLIKGILATVQNEGAELTEFKPTILDVCAVDAVAKALCCICPNIYKLVINGIECLIYADDSGAHDDNSVVTMIIRDDAKVAFMFFKNYFVCKFSHGYIESLSDAECETILGNLKITAFGYFPSRYLLIDL